MKKNYTFEIRVCNEKTLEWHNYYYHVKAKNKRKAVFKALKSFYDKHGYQDVTITYYKSTEVE